MDQAYRNAFRESMLRRMPRLRAMNKDKTARLAFELLEIMGSSAEIPAKIRRLRQSLKSQDLLLLMKASTDLRGELDPHMRDHIRNACRLLDALFAAAYRAAKKAGLSDDDIGVGLASLNHRVKRARTRPRPR